MTVTELIPVIQVSIAPVILMSSVALLLLTLTNRFGRVVDLSRGLSAQLKRADKAERIALEQQVVILYRRSRRLRTAISLAALSVLLSSLLVVTLFVAKLAGMESGLHLALLFVASLVCLCASLVAFIQDISFSLKALDLELR